MIYMENLPKKNLLVCRMCFLPMDSERCPGCESLCPSRNVEDLNINAAFTDYSYNRHDKFFIFKVYLQWLKFSTLLFSQKNVFIRFLRKIFAPLLGGSPALAFSKNESFIDIGCGRGFFLRYLPKEWSISGTDIVNYKNTDISIMVGNFEKFPETKKFTIVRSSHSLEHAIHPTVFLDKIIAITEKDGIIVISSPNADSLSSRIFGKNWVPFNVDSHFCILNISTLKKYLEDNGCKVIYYGTYTLFSSAGSLIDILKIKRFYWISFFLINIILLPLTAIELLIKKGDSLIIYAKKI